MLSALTDIYLLIIFSAIQTLQTKTMRMDRNERLQRRRKLLPLFFYFQLLIIFKLLWFNFRGQRISLWLFLIGKNWRNFLGKKQRSLINLQKVCLSLYWFRNKKTFYWCTGVKTRMRCWENTQKILQHPTRDIILVNLWKMQSIAFKVFYSCARSFCSNYSLGLTYHNLNLMRWQK